MDNHDPGPMFFPGLLATLLGCCGLVCWAGGRRCTAGDRLDPTATEIAGDGSATSVQWLPVLLLVLGLSAYVVGLGWLGFTLSTLLFSTAMMRWLGSRWPLAIGVSLVMVVIVKSLFVGAFKVQLPTGELGLPF